MKGEMGKLALTRMRPVWPKGAPFLFSPTHAYIHKIYRGSVTAVGLGLFLLEALLVE